MIVNTKREVYRLSERQRKEKQVLRLCQRTKKAVVHEGDSDTNYDWCDWNGPHRLGKELGRVENQGSNRNSGIVEIGQNTGDQMKLVII